MLSACEPAGSASINLFVLSSLVMRPSRFLLSLKRYLELEPRFDEREWYSEGHYGPSKSAYYEIGSLYLPSRRLALPAASLKEFSLSASL